MSADLHLARSRDPLVADKKLLNRANRLAGVANAVGDIDLKAVADSYQREAGGSGIEAAAVAAAALGAALKASLMGSDMDSKQCAEAAKNEVRKAAVKKSREAKVEAVMQERVAQEGHLGQQRSEATRDAQNHRSQKAVEEKEERLADQAAERRAMREERAMAAAGKRTLAEARARFGKNLPRSDSESGDSPTAQISVLKDDPAIRKAKALVSGASQVVATLEAQNASMKARAFKPEQPKVMRPAPSSAEDEALIAKAKELLADYKPPEQQKRPAVPAAKQPLKLPAPATRPPSQQSSPSGGETLSALQLARQQCANVCVEMTEKSNRLRR
mmetsp:Transcript_7449/g.13209  ORF Transcript_7449/g.13209 Transcript_7449/m.13209 type:complete len:331 (+) Transcript_7449:129-1121(+)